MDDFEIKLSVSDSSLTVYESDGGGIGPMVGLQIRADGEGLAWELDLDQAHSLKVWLEEKLSSHRN